MHITSLSTVLMTIAMLVSSQGISLNSAVSFGVLSGSAGVTSTGTTHISGDLGTTGVSITGFPPGTITGTEHIGDAVAVTAQKDAIDAYNDAKALPVDYDYSATSDLTGMTLYPGVYFFAASASLSGPLYLSAEATVDDCNSIDPTVSSKNQFIFQIGTTLLIHEDSQVIFQGSASACNVFWQVGSSATLATGVQMAGNILAYAAITAVRNASIVGGLYSNYESITMDTNAITVPICGGPVDGCSSSVLSSSAATTSSALSSSAATTSSALSSSAATTSSNLPSSAALTSSSVSPRSSVVDMPPFANTTFQRVSSIDSNATSAPTQMMTAPSSAYASSSLVYQVNLTSQVASSIQSNATSAAAQITTIPSSANTSSSSAFHYYTNTTTSAAISSNESHTSTQAQAPTIASNASTSAIATSSRSHFSSISVPTSSSHLNITSTFSSLFTSSSSAFTSETSSSKSSPSSSTSSSSKFSLSLSLSTLSSSSTLLNSTLSAKTTSTSPSPTTSASSPLVCSHWPTHTSASSLSTTASNLSRSTTSTLKPSTSSSKAMTTLPAPTCAPQLSSCTSLATLPSCAASCLDFNLTIGGSTLLCISTDLSCQCQRNALDVSVDLCLASCGNAVKVAAKLALGRACACKAAAEANPIGCSI